MLRKLELVDFACLASDCEPLRPIKSHSIVTTAFDSSFLFERDQEPPNLIARPKWKDASESFDAIVRPNFSVDFILSIQRIAMHPKDEVVKHDGFADPVLLSCNRIEKKVSSHRFDSMRPREQ